MYVESKEGEFTKDRTALVSNCSRVGKEERQKIGDPSADVGAG